MKGALSDFLEKLQEEETVVAEQLAADTLGLTLRVALNELDWYSYNILRATNPNREQAEQWRFIRLGVDRLVKLTFDRVPSFEVPTITLRRQIELSKQVFETVAHLGFIQHGRWLAEFARSGRCQIERLSETDFEFCLPEKIMNPEAHERDITDHYRREASRIRTETIENSAEGKTLSAHIESLLEENVFVFREHFMGYRADPLLDEYFFQLGWSELANSEEFDSFNEAKCFGGVTYLKYLLATAYLISICAKHERYCAAMVRIEPQIFLQDILTISADRNTFVEEMCCALNRFGMNFQNYTQTTVEETWKIYEVISLNRRDVRLLAPTTAALPCIVDFVYLTWPLSRI